jgi:hypothetical protein
LSQTPPVNASWQASGDLSASSGFPSDTQIAVSSTHILVTARAIIAFYDKGGIQLQPPLSTSSFFGGLKLGEKYGIDHFYDTRTIFDSFRKRFWIAALTYNSPHKQDTQRRDIVVLAVSKTENPLDGWYQYYYDAVAHYGEQNDPVFQPGDGADYPILGIDKTCIYQTNAVSNNQTSMNRYWRVIFFSAEKMSSGVSFSNVESWQFWDLLNPDSSQAWRIQPVVHHDSSPHTYFVSQFGTNQLLIWGLTNPLQANQQMQRAEVTVSPFTFPPDAPQKNSAAKIRMTNFGNSPLKAVYRKNKLYTVMNDARDWFGDSNPTNSIRLMRINVSEFPKISTNKSSGFINRIFGANNPIEDDRKTRMYYGWPAIEVNKDGNMAIVYTRTGTTIFPEMRYSSYYNAENDIRPSRIVKAGEKDYFQSLSTNTTLFYWGDIAGASVDPSDDKAIWIAHQYASSSATSASAGNFQVWVGRVFA